jgi:hypothetical protein
MTALGPFDIYGRSLVTALLREGAKPETIAALRVAMASEGATFTVEEVAAELGVIVPPVPFAVDAERRPEPCRPPRKRRAA